MPENLNFTDVFRIVIDGDWTADQMSSFYRACDDVYNFSHSLIYLQEPSIDSVMHGWLQSLFRDWYYPNVGALAGTWPFASSDDILSRVSLLIHGFAAHEELRDQAEVYPLQVTRVQYGSEGFKDFVGIGEVLKQLKEFIFGIIDRCMSFRAKRAELDGLQLDNEERRKKIEQLELQNRLLRTELLEHQVRVLREVGMSKTAIRNTLIGLDQRTDIIESLAMSKRIKAIQSTDEHRGAY